MLDHIFYHKYMHNTFILMHILILAGIYQIFQKILYLQVNLFNNLIYSIYAFSIQKGGFCRNLKAIDLKMILLIHRNNYVGHSSCSKFFNTSTKLLYPYIYFHWKVWEKILFILNLIHFWDVISTLDTFNTDDVSRIFKIRVQRLHLIMKSDLQNSRFVSTR